MAQNNRLFHVQEATQSFQLEGSRAFGLYGATPREGMLPWV